MYQRAGSKFKLARNDRSRLFGHPVPWALGLALAGMAAIVQPSLAQLSAHETPIAFSIPAQPLARALIAYSAATGLEIFYNAALADHQHSTVVAGTLTPSAALQVLLRGTGYVARSTGAGAFTIAPAPRETTVTSAETRRRLQPYFAAVQPRINDVLCRGDAVEADKELLFRFWLSLSGVVTRAEVIDEDGQPVQDQTAAAAIQGLALLAPPAGMPQPINMVIFPSSKAARVCNSANTARGAR